MLVLADAMSLAGSLRGDMPIRFVGDCCETRLGAGCAATRDGAAPDVAGRLEGELNAALRWMREAPASRSAA